MGADLAEACAAIEPLIAALAEGTGSPTAEGTVRAHLEACDGCQQLARDLALGATDLEKLSTVDPGLYVRGEELGRGGVGRIVYARDRRLGRVVALKELLDQRMRAPFEREARLTARLQHPSIVSVHEAGVWPSGEPFYAMRYVEGRSLDRVIAATRSVAERVRLLPTIIAVADAVAYAHSMGVVHRDLKPQNILVGDFGETVVIDWGLAKDLWADHPDRAGDSSPLSHYSGPDLTRDGAGTPMYMPPEQAAGKGVDARADVYALGATLYHVLAGRVPASRQLAESEAIVAEGDSAQRQPLDPAVPPELAAVVAKAMALDPAARYTTAVELADELRRFQAGRLLMTHRYTARQLVVRFLRRNRALVGLAGAALVVLAVVGAVSLRGMVRAREVAERQRAVADRQRAVADSQRAEAEREAARVAFLSGDPLQAAARVRNSLEVEDSTAGRAAFDSLSKAPLIVRKKVGFPRKLAFSASGDELGVSTVDGISLFSTRTWAARRLDTPDQALTLAFSADGKSIVAGLFSGQVLAWDVPSGRPRLIGSHRRGGVRSVQVSADGALIASGGQEALRLWQAGEARVLHGHTGPVTSVALTPDSRSVASGSSDGTVRVWDTKSGVLRAVSSGHGAYLWEVVFAPDGRALLSAGDDGAVRLWDAETGAERRTFRGPAGPIRSVSVSRDGKSVAAGAFDNTVWVWDLATGRPRAMLEGEHTSPVVSVSFSPDGKLVASLAQGEGELSIWDLERTGTDAPSHPRSPRGSVAFSPDGTKLATGGRRSVGIYDVLTGKPLDASLRAPGESRAAATASFVAYGRDLVVAGGAANVLFVWRLGTRLEPRVLEGHAGWITAVALSGDERSIVSTSFDKTARVWDAATGRQRVTFSGHSLMVTSVALAPDARIAATGGMDATIRLWSIDDGRQLEVLSGHGAAVGGLAFRADGALLSASNDGTVRLWENRPGGHGRPRGSRIVAQHDGRFYGVAWHPDGRRAALSSADGTARILDLETDRSLVLVGHLGEVTDVTFSPDGRLCATVSLDETVRMWDSNTGSPVWRAPLLFAGTEVELYTHTGWRSLEGGDPGVPRASAWRARVPGARVAAQSTDERTLCIAGDVSVELWDLASDARRFSSALPAAEQLLALGDACVTLAGGVAWRVDQAGATRLTDGATAAAADGDGVLIAHGDTIDHHVGAARVHVGPGSPSVTALLRTPRGLLVGFKHGRLELRPADGGPATSVTMVGSPVVTLARGARDTVIVGYGNGILEVWPADLGARLDQMRIHGPVRHVRVRNGRLYAASDLGDWLAADVSAYEMGYCDLMRRVWRAIPIRWEGGQPVARDVPDDHFCADSAGADDPVENNGGSEKLR